MDWRMDAVAALPVPRRGACRAVASEANRRARPTTSYAKQVLVHYSVQQDGIGIGAVTS